MEPYVWVFDTVSKKARRKAPKNLFAETDFYTVSDEPGERDLSLERCHQVLEGQFARIRREKLDKELPVTIEEAACLAAFVVAMSFRTRAHRERRRREWTNLASVMEQLELRRGPNGERAEARFSTSPNPKDPSLSLNDIRKLAANPIRYMMAREIGLYIPIVSRLQMQVLRTDDPIGFITSDDPCVWISETELQTPPRLSELGEFSIYMPVSPRQFLHLNPYESAYGKIPGTVVDWLNGYTWRHAHEYAVVNKNEIRDAWFGPKRDFPTS